MFFPSYCLGLGVKSESPQCLPFGSSLALFAFASAFCFVMGGADYFFVYFWMALLETHSTLLLDSYFYFSPSGVMFSSFGPMKSNIEKVGPNFGSFCLKIGRSFKWSNFFKCKCLL
jgi:hypothetical protein